MTNVKDLEGISRKTKDAEKLIANYNTKHEYGFTGEEVKDVLHRLKVDVEDYAERLGVYTGMFIEGDSITYHSDVLLGVTLSIQDREMTIAEWD